MNRTRIDRRGALACLGALAFAPLLAHAAGAPGNSVYQLGAKLVDQEGRAFDWSELRGQPLLVSMFYTSCEMVCPMIFETVHMTLKALPPAERDAMKVLMVSFDPARDTVEVLKKTAQQRQCDKRWTLARPDEATARKIAAVLGIQYRRLESGEFNHSTTLLLIDREGRIAARSGQLGKVDPALVKAVHKALA